MEPDLAATVLVASAKHGDRAFFDRLYAQAKKETDENSQGNLLSAMGSFRDPEIAELGFELWVGDPAEIRAKRVRKQRNDRFDAEHIRKLLIEDRFPRIWMPSPENRGVRQLLLHRHRFVASNRRTGPSFNL